MVMRVYQVRSRLDGSGMKSGIQSALAGPLQPCGRDKISVPPKFLELDEHCRIIHHHSPDSRYSPPNHNQALKKHFVCRISPHILKHANCPHPPQ